MRIRWGRGGANIGTVKSRKQEVGPTNKLSKKLVMAHSHVTYRFQRVFTIVVCLKTNASMHLDMNPLLVVQFACCLRK